MSSCTIAQQRPPRDSNPELPAPLRFPARPTGLTRRRASSHYAALYSGRGGFYYSNPTSQKQQRVDRRKQSANLNLTDAVKIHELLRSPLFPAPDIPLSVSLSCESVSDSVSVSVSVSVSASVSVSVSASVCHARRPLAAFAHVDHDMAPRTLPGPSQDPP